jgi:hypothetical protein
MLWRRAAHEDWEQRAVVCRRTHERFLTRALQNPDAFPHIPLRRVADGGFDRLRLRAGGLARAEQWWRAALERVQAR